MKAELKTKVIIAIIGVAFATMLVPATAMAQTADSVATDVTAGNEAPVNTVSTNEITPDAVVDALVGPADPALPADFQNDGGDFAPDSVPAPTTTQKPAATVEEEIPASTPVTSDDAGDGDSGKDGEAPSTGSDVPAREPENAKVTSATSATNGAITMQELSGMTEGEEGTSQGIHWEYIPDTTGTGMLRIYTDCSYSGYRPIPDYSSPDQAPWYKYKDNVTYIELCRVTRIGNNAFNGYGNVTNIMLEGDSFTEIGTRAFYNCVGLYGDVWIPGSVQRIEDYAFDADNGTYYRKYQIGNPGYETSKLTYLGTRALGGPIYVTVTYAGKRADWDNISGANDYISNIEFDESSHVVTFNPDGGILANGEETGITNASGQLTSLPTPTKIGYAFNGWYYDDGYELTANSGRITDDVTVTARWTKIPYVITSDVNGGDMGSYATTMTAQSDGTLAGLPVPMRTGHTFDGWFDAAGNEVEANVTVFTGDATLTARWSALTYTIIFDANGGDLTGDATLETDENGKLASLPSDPVREGYTFDGWFNAQEDGERVTTETVFDASIFVYAHWTLKEPTDPVDPVDPDDPDNSDGPGNPDDPGNPDNPDDPGNPDDPSEPSTPSYTVISGAGSTWVASGDADLEVRANGEFANFDHLKVDGVRVDEKHYDVREGSTIVTIKRAFLAALEEGSHNLTFVYKDGGEASTAFTVAAEPAVYVPGADDATPTQVADQTAKAGVSGSDNPKTNDAGNLMLCVLMLLAGIAGLCGTRIARRVCL